MRGVSKPPPTEARDRLISDDEKERLLFALGYSYDSPPSTTTARVGAALLFAMETAMRAGEIVKLRQEDLHLDQRYLSTSGKTAAATRNVPLSTEAMRILRQLPEGDPVFGIPSTASLDALFRKAKAKALVAALHFHDTRHHAITQLAKKLSVLELARSVGHRDLKQLLVYYNETAEVLAAKLA